MDKLFIDPGLHIDGNVCLMSYVLSIKVRSLGKRFGVLLHYCCCVTVIGFSLRFRLLCKWAGCRYWNVELWRGFFETLLNVNNSLDNPPLRALRKNFEDHLTSNSLGKKVKELLAKQTIMMFIRR